MAKRSAHLLVLAVCFLVALGVVMLTSTTVYDGGAPSDDPYFGVKRQLMWVSIGLVACIAVALVDYREWFRFAWWIYAGVIALLVLCFVPHVGQTIHGESRWIDAGLIGLSAIQIQPSEFAKIALIVIIARWYAMRPDCAQRFWSGLVAPLYIGGFMILLVLFEVDMGTSAVMSVTLFGLLFVAGVSWKYLSGLAVTGSVAFFSMLAVVPNRVERLLAFLDLEAHRAGAGLQQWVSLLAFGSGGVSGLGLGSGRLKMLYMPFAHTDFIFPMIGEELGLPFTLAVVFSFVVFAVMGITIAFHAPDRFGRILAIGIVLVITTQAALNLGVTTAVLPNTGLPLPFVSYGGSALLSAMIGVGLLLSIYRHSDPRRPQTNLWIPKGRITPRL
jgi:cell division protein FtsW